MQTEKKRTKKNVRLKKASNRPAFSFSFLFLFKSGVARCERGRVVGQAEACAPRAPGPIDWRNSARAQLLLRQRTRALRIGQRRVKMMA